MNINAQVSASVLFCIYVVHEFVFLLTWLSMLIIIWLGMFTLEQAEKVTVEAITVFCHPWVRLLYDLSSDLCLCVLQLTNVDVVRFPCGVLITEVRVIPPGVKAHSNLPDSRGFG